MPPLNSWQIMPVPPPTLPSATGPPAALQRRMACSVVTGKLPRIGQPAVIGFRDDRQMEATASATFSRRQLQIASRTTPTQWV